MVNIAVVGFGNLGRGVMRAIERNADMRLTAVFSRRHDSVREEVKDVPVLPSDVIAVPRGVKIDVAVLCGGSKEDTPAQGLQFIERFSTVDSFDTHADIPRYFHKMDAIARAKGNVAIISAGWDPGIFSLERVLGGAFLPGGKSYTFWGPGVSQGHSDAARKVKGVIDARQYTMPIESALKQVREGKVREFTKREMHKRVVYVVAEKGVDKERITREIVEMPNYYADYDTEVHFITVAEMKRSHSSYPHGGFVLTSGLTGKNNREILEYSDQLTSNPEFTGSVLVACARAAYRLKKGGACGAYTMLDVPAALLSPHTGADLRKHYM